MIEAEIVYVYIMFLVMRMMMISELIVVVQSSAMRGTNYNAGRLDTVVVPIWLQKITHFGRQIVPCCNWRLAHYGV